MKTAHLIEVRYVGATNFKPSRVTLTSLRFKDKVTFSYDSEFGDLAKQAEKWLGDHGFELDSYGESPKGFIFASTTFKSLKSA